jgi:hypothetical protein
VTDLLDVAVVNAGLDLMRADTLLNVFDGVVPSPTPTPPYVLVYSTVTWPSDDDTIGALDGRSRRVVARWICHCVGESQQASREVAQRVRAALLDARPQIAGLQPGFIRDEQDDPPVRNEQTGVVVFDAVHVYRLNAVL